MKKLLKVLVPPFIGFTVFFIAVRYSSLYFELRIDEMGDGSLRSFMAFYRYIMPLLFTVAILMQLLVIVPIWNSVLNKPRAIKINAGIDLFFTCFIFALGISYAISDFQAGVSHFVKLLIFTTTVQLAYWMINLFTMYLME